MEYRHVVNTWHVKRWKKLEMPVAEADSRENINPSPANVENMVSS